ncbi:MAG: class I SAM-dependent methyltransferase [Mycobacterium sp.]
MTSQGPITRWNNNIHYHRVILEAIPAAARTALDVGTGNGLLAADLHKLLPEVTGLDADADVLESARREDPEVNWLVGDIMTYPFEPASFDVVASVATIHHLPDVTQTLTRLAELVAPGGVLAVVGLARSTRPGDALYDLAGLVQQQRFKRRYGIWEHSAPIFWPPPHSYAEARRAARQVLPGARWTRLTMWRYALIWDKPTT